MQCVTEPTKSYSDLDALREDLYLMKVEETRPFSLSKMNLTAKGTLEVENVGEFLLSDISLGDALRRGGLQVSCCQNYFQESKTILDEAIVNAVNSFYKHSRFSDSQVKLTTRANNGDSRVVLGITSDKYVLYTHEEAVEKIVRNIPSHLKLTRANLYPVFLNLGFTDPINTVKDKVGETVAIGLSFLNSQGTRTSSLVASSFSLRLVCRNGAVAKDNVFSARYVHKGNLRRSNGDFGRQTNEILQRFSLMMQNLPRLGEIPVTEKLIHQIRPTLTESLSVKEAEEFIKSVNTPEKTVMDVWNRVTNLPHHIKDAQTKLKLEQLGFQILTLNLCYNRN